jgi:hypothetical protein
MKNKSVNCRRHINKSIICGLFLSILVLNISGCQSSRVYQNNNNLLDWKYTDIRQLDPIDAIDPALDVIAVYSRFNQGFLQLRIDFLNLDQYLGNDIYIVIDTNPGGTNQIMTHNHGIIQTDLKWDYLIEFTASGNAAIYNSQYKTVDEMEIFIIYDSAQDRIILTTLKNNIPIYAGKTNLQVLVTSPDNNIIADKGNPFSVDATSPARAKVVLAFWNTFSPESPAQTLRSWAGAHTGPNSSRHGLKYLVDAASQYKIPILLIDLLSPSNISALDYLGEIPKLNALHNKGIVKFYNTREINSNKRLSVISSLFLNSNINDNDYAQFLNNSSCNLRENDVNNNVINLGLSLDCKKLLSLSAYYQPSTPLLFGGDISQSTLGDPATLEILFSYIITHPWIQVLSYEHEKSLETLLNIYPANIDNNRAPAPIKSLMTFPSDVITPTSLQLKVKNLLSESPDNQLTDLSQQTLYLLEHPNNSQLVPISNNYIGQVGEILAAAKWADSPTSTQNCSTDLDFDNTNECILSNSEVFVIVDREGGYIPFIFSRDGNGVHQIIGPTWEFAVGLSDPSLWNPELGLRSDPSQILGAFQDSFSNWNSYIFDFNGNKLNLYNDNMAMRKSFSISADKIQISILAAEPFDTYAIPLVVDPWIRFTPNWGTAYSGIKSDYSYTWGISSVINILTKSATPIDAFAFKDTYRMMTKPEDSNYDYSRGHYLPYPLAMVELTGWNNYKIDIQINP